MDLADAAATNLLPNIWSECMRTVADTLCSCQIVMC